MSNLDRYAKAIVSAVLAGLGGAQVASADGSGITLNEWVWIAIAVFSSLGVVYYVPNALPPAAVPSAAQRAIASMTARPAADVPAAPRPAAPGGAVVAGVLIIAMALAGLYGLTRVAGPGPGAPIAAAAVSDDGGLAFAQDQLRQCQTLLASATTAAQRSRAQTCIADAQRAIAWIQAHPTPSPTPSATPTGTPTPAPSATLTPSPTPSVLAWPNATNTGVPAGWTPAHIVSGDLVVSTPGVVQDVRVVGGSIRVKVPGVTVRRAEVIDGGVYFDVIPDSGCHDLVIEDVWIHATSPSTVAEAGPVVSPGGYTARRVRIDGNITEGFRVGERVNSTGGPRCTTPVLIEDSFVRIDNPSDCVAPPYPDWHGDGIQGYKGAGLTLRHSTVQMLGNSPSKTPCEGTSPLFWPDQENGPITVDRVLVSGGAYYSARLLTAGSVRGLLVDADHSSITAACSLLSPWDATAVHIGPDYQVTQVLGPIACKL